MTTDPRTSSTPDGTPPPPLTAPPPDAVDAAPAPGSGFWTELDRLGIRRDRQGGWLGGVCAGLARSWGVDPLLVRALVIALTVIGGFGAVAYLAAWLLLPDAEGRILLREAGHGNGTGIALVVLLAVIVLTGLSQDSAWFGGWLVPAAVLVLFLVLRSSRGSAPTPSGTTPGFPAPGGAGTPPLPPTGNPHAIASDGVYAVPPASPSTPVVPPVPVAPPQPPRPTRRRAPKGTGAVVLGLAVVGYGVGHMVAAVTDAPMSAGLLGLFLALALTSTAALVLGVRGRRGGLASVLTLILLFPVAGAVAAERVDLNSGEAVVWAPTTATEVRQVGAGTLTVDLSQLPVGTDGDPSPWISARLGTGDLSVIVPEGTELTIHAAIGIGEFSVGPFAPTSSSGGAVGVQVDGDANGLGINRTVTVSRPSGTGAPLRPVRLDANVGVGSIRLQEK